MKAIVLILTMVFVMGCSMTTGQTMKTAHDMVDAAQMPAHDAVDLLGAVYHDLRSFACYLGEKLGDTPCVTETPEAQ